MRSVIFVFFIALCSNAWTNTWIISSLDDSGGGTLRQALTNFLEGDSIIFNNSLSGTLLLQSPLPDITQDVTILGPSSQAVTIDGNNTYRIFHVNGGSSYISNLNFAGGVHSNQGGALYLQNGVVNLMHCNVTLCGTSEGINPIYVENTATLNFFDVTFSASSDSEIFLNGSTLSLTNTDLAGEYIIDGTNSAGIYKYGTNTATITVGSSNTIATVVVNAGLVNLHGNVSEPCIVFSDGSLCGTFSTQYIVNYGIIRPDNNGDVGIISLTEDFMQYSGGVEIKINPEGNCDLIQATNYAFLYGSNLTIIPSTGNYTPGTKYTFLTAGNAISGTFNSFSSGGLDVQINYNATSVEIEILGVKKEAKKAEKVKKKKRKNSMVKKN